MSNKILIFAAVLAATVFGPPATAFAAPANKAIAWPAPVPKIAQDPKLSFNGYFKHHQPVKIVFAIGQPGGQTNESLVNAALVINYLRSKGYRYKIHIVFYSKGVLIADRFNGKYSASWGPELDLLSKHGVTFSVCHNAMSLFHVKSDELYPYMRPIPAGILSIAEYEGRGYLPIFNPNSVTGSK